MPHGGPDGGNGGDGGDVVLVASSHKNTLIHLRFRPHLRAEGGEHGRGRNRNGSRGQSLEIEVPAGTVIKDENGAQLGDLLKPGTRAVVARGGRGGRGNSSFATSRQRAPGFAEKGEPGEERTLLLELKLLADIGLVGFPNAGKSTFLARVSAARPKIADYPFTTLVPQLGVVYLGEERSFVVADLPGIIEGAHQGAGLGHRFLKHIERSRVLLYILDMAAVEGEGRDPFHDYQLLKKELHNYQEELAMKPAIVAANKMDLPGADENLQGFYSRAAAGDLELFPISGVTGEGIDNLLEALYSKLQKEKGPELDEEMDVDTFYLPPLPEVALSVQRDGEIFHVRGDQAIKAIARADLHNEEGLRRFQELIRRLGVENELLKAGIQEGDTVKIGEMEFLYFP